MKRLILIAALALAACGRNAAAPAPAASPELAQPAAEPELANRYRGANQAAQALGEITVTLATHLPEAAAEGQPVERLSLRGAGNFIVEADLSGAAEPALTVQGSTVRALMGLDVGAAQTLVYRVTRAEGQSLCGQTAAAYVVIWQPEGPGENELKILPLAGGAPGETQARACARLDYARA